MVKLFLAVAEEEPVVAQQPWLGGQQQRCGKDQLAADACGCDLLQGIGRNQPVKLGVEQVQVELGDGGAERLLQITPAERLQLRGELGLGHRGGQPDGR